MKVLFRTDASLQIGSGHIMRCLTLAESLRQIGAEVMFACRRLPGNLVGLLFEKGFEVYQLPMENFEPQGHCTAKPRVTVEDYSDWLGCSQDQDAQATLKAIGKAQFDWLIVDHYGLDEYWERQLRPITKKLMVIDDLANRAHDCELLLDQNYFVNATSRYDELIPPSPSRLLGPKYALLRPEFAEAQKQLRPRTGKVQRIFVFFGGTDTDNLTGLTLESLSDPTLEHLEVDVVIGINNPHKDKITAQVAQRPRTKLHVQIANIASLMAQADLAIGAGGSTTWERLSLQLPSITVTIAENQHSFTEELHEQGLIERIGDGHSVTVENLRQALQGYLCSYSNLSEGSPQPELVDGKGTARVTYCLCKGISPKDWLIRQATMADCALYWHWANDPVVRQQAFSKEQIQWEDHVSWFEEKVHDEKTMLVLVVSQLGPVGQVRFEYFQQQAKISYSIGRAMRGFGLAKHLMKQAIAFFQSHHSLGLYAEVKPTNLKSVKVFEELNFEDVFTRMMEGTFVFFDYL